MTEVPEWWLTKDGDIDCLALYERHYPLTRKCGPRRIGQFVGPGEKRVFRTEAGDAVFAWRKFLDDCIDERTGKPQEGVNCAIFRNESAIRSSDLVRQADAIADFLWADRRHYTYVDPARVASGLPGNCFLRAGWRYARHRGDDGRWHRMRTKSGLLILERVVPSETPAQDD